MSLPAWGAHAPLPLFSSGIALAAIYRWGRQMATAAFAASAAAQIWVDQPMLVALTSGVGLAGGALLSDWLLRRARFDPTFGRAQDVPIFIFATALGMAVAPTVGVAGFSLAGFPYPASAIVHWSRWWSNVAAGVVMVGPVLIAISRQGFVRFMERWLAGTAWIVGVGVCCAIIVWTPGPAGRSMIIMFALLLVVVGSIRFGLVVSMLGSMAISFTTAAGFDFGFGLFGQFDELPGRLTLFTFGATLNAVSLLIAALLAERDAVGLERLQAERRYAHIFNGSPQAVWVHDPSTLRFLLVNDAALQLYGWQRGEFLAMTVCALAPAGEAAILPPASLHTTGSSTRVAPFEARHVTRDGRVVEVDVWMRSIVLGGRAAALVFALDVSERRASGRALIDGLAAEQQRIAGEIHDGLGQELTGLSLSLRALATRAQRSSQPLATELDELAKLATHCIESSQRMVQGLSPLSDAGGNLEKALQGLARRASMSGTPVRFRLRGTPPSAARGAASDHFYRIAQEAVQNALKHADATAIDIELWIDRSAVGLAVVDDGRGLPSGILHTGLGMRTMQFRASAIGGSLSIESPSGGGTAVRCEVPLAGYEAVSSGGAAPTVG